jgi:polyribonucleotide nucleotidyltransferase
MQMDVKIDGIVPEIVSEVLEQAYKARMEIMEVMLTAIPEPRKELSRYAPSIITMKIAEEKIREVIGPGGKIINEIIDETGANIDIEDDGTIFITAENGEGGQKAQKMIQDIVREVEVGEVYPEARVVKIVDFGAFVELWPGGKEGLVHISKIADERIDKVENYLKLGQKVAVKVAEIDQMGRINLTMKGLENDVKRRS